MADTSKKRAKIWRRVRQNRLKLTRLLKRYRAATGTDLTPEDDGDGRFPWHDAASREPGRIGPSLSEKRALCDAYMRLCRAREEVDIVAAEMVTFISTSESVLLDLESNLTVRAQSRCRDKPPLVRPSLLLFLGLKKRKMS